MPWRPLVTKAARAEVAELAKQLHAAIARIPVVDAVTEWCDQALLQAYAGLESAETLTVAIERLAEHGAPPGLYSGGARVGWTVAHLADPADPDTVEQVCAPIDDALTATLAEQPWRRDYDLIRGLVGFGVYALERGGEVGAKLVDRVLDRLAGLAQPRHGGLAWLTPAELLPPHQRERAPHGYWNLGLAHGAPGVVALCA